MQKSVSFLFPTPIGEFRVPDTEETNRALKELILAKEQSEPGEVFANAGGWHSTMDLLDWKHPAINVVRGWFSEAVNVMMSSTLQMMKQTGMKPGNTRCLLKATAWANVIRFGNYHRFHNHPNSVWSGVYYVDAGLDAPNHPFSGLLELPDPRPFANMVTTPGEPFAQKALIKPEAGMIVMFPSWYYHFVHPYYAEGTRISIAFNVSTAADTAK